MHASNSRFLGDRRALFASFLPLRRINDSAFQPRNNPVRPRGLSKIAQAPSRQPGLVTRDYEGAHSILEHPLGGGWQLQRHTNERGFPSFGRLDLHIHCTICNIPEPLALLAQHSFRRTSIDCLVNHSLFHLIIHSGILSFSCPLAGEKEKPKLSPMGPF